MREYCTYSADPVGRLVLGVYGRAGEQELVRMSDSICTGLQLVNFLQDPPRDLALGRVYLPQNDLARFGVADDDLAGPLTDEIVALLRYEGDRARSLLEAGLPLAKALGGRAGMSVALYARGGLAALDALERAGWDVFTSRPAPTKWTFARPRLPGALPAVNTEQAYAETDRITRETARNFAWGIRVLPGPKRRAIAALYAFARRVDDLADQEEPARRRARVAGGPLSRRCPPSQDGDAILVALADAMSRYPIPPEALVDLVDGALMDFDRNRYASWDELREYCRRVAGAVGVACARRLRAFELGGGEAPRADARSRAAADQHHARRRRGLVARACVSPSGRAEPVRRERGGDRRR